MSNTYYTSLSGMIAASYGLQNTSNNVANMQSPGYKRNDVFYSSLGNGASHNGLGSGVYVGGHNTNFSDGTYLDTKNASDLAVVGNGFFVVKLKNGEFLYTRDGEFGFNTDGLLIDKHSGGLVQGYDQQGGLVSISQFGATINPGKTTHFIDLKGEFIISELENNSPVPDPDPTKSKYAPIEFKVNIFDEQGKSHQVTLKFEAPHTPVPEGSNTDYRDNLHWQLINATCNDDSSIDFEDQAIEFSSDSGGAANQGANTIKFSFNKTQMVTLSFGDYSIEADSSVRLNKNEKSNPKSSSIEEKKQDGYGFGRQIDFSFDDNGQIKYKYDNGQSEEGHFVALAMFDDLEHTLVPANDNLFRAKNTHGLRMNRPNKENFGAIQSKKLEASNVDSTKEFANIVVLQRMFQACSQIMDIDKQLLEELYK